MAAIAAVLARYPHEIIMAVTHPVTGLPSSSSWLPTIKEVTDACNAAVEPIRQHEARLKRIQQQMEAREREDRREKPTLEQLHERFGADWGLKQENHKTPDIKSEENRAAFEREQARVRAEYEHLGLTAPSKWALSPATLREIAERDAMKMTDYPDPAGSNRTCIGGSAFVDKVEQMVLRGKEPISRLRPERQLSQ